MSVNSDFTPEEIAKCRAAMDKPSPLECLRAIASGNVTVSVRPDGRDIWLETLHGRPARDPEHPDRKMLVAGGWPLFRAGMIDAQGRVTPLGREMARLVP